MARILKGVQKRGQAPAGAWVVLQNANEAYGFLVGGNGRTGSIYLSGTTEMRLFCQNWRESQIKDWMHH